MYGLWNRLQYMLSPQFDIYEKVAGIVSGRVADIGSGTGFGAHLFTRNCDMVVGVEVDAVARKFAQRAFSNGKIQFFEGDITSRKSPGHLDYYDYITMIDVIEHIEDTKIALKNINEFLKPKGTFICSTPNRLSRYRKSEYHVREYSPEELESLLLCQFPYVKIVDYQLEPIKSEYENPIIAICS